MDALKGEAADLQMAKRPGTPALRRTASRPGSQCFAWAAVFEISNVPRAAQPLRPGTGRGPGEVGAGTRSRVLLPMRTGVFETGDMGWWSLARGHGCA